MVNSNEYLTNIPESEWNGYTNDYVKSKYIIVEEQFQKGSYKELTINKEGIVSTLTSSPQSGITSYTIYFSGYDQISYIQKLQNY